MLFGPWMNGVTTFMYNGRFDAAKELELIARYGVTTFCAPPTEYRILIKENLADYSFPKLRHCTGAGEPLNPEVIEVWRERLGLTIHDGYGQTETIILAANMPAMPVKPGSMGLPFPGHDVRVIDDKLAETQGRRDRRNRGAGKSRAAAVAVSRVLEKCAKRPPLCFAAIGT